MFVIPNEYFINDTVHRSLCSDMNNGILSCGFLHKKANNSSEINIKFDYYGALLLLSGEGIQIDTEGREYRLYPGCFVQRIPGKPHSTYVKPDGKWLEFFICFGKDLYDSLLKMNVLDSDHDVLYPGINIAIFDVMINFLNSMKSASQENLPLLLAEAQRIIFTIYQMHLNTTMKDEGSEVVRQACQLFSANPEKRISAREVAAELGVGYEKFRKLFKSKMHISPGEYIIQERINKSKSLLIDTSKSINEVAFVMGFPDSYSFSKQFKKVTGIPPGEFKRKY